MAIVNGELGFNLILINLNVNRNMRLGALLLHRIVIHHLNPYIYKYIIYKHIKYLERSKKKQGNLNYS